MYIVADISKGKILTGLLTHSRILIFIYCIDLCITYPFLTGLIYMLQKYALKVKTFKLLVIGVSAKLCLLLI